MAKKKSVKSVFESTKTSHFDTYRINKVGDHIFMTIIPGDTGQASVTEAYLEGVALFKNKAGAIEDYDLGVDTELRSKFLDVYTAVTDIPGEPDKTSFDFLLSGGVSDYEYFSEKTVSQQGDSVIYKITIAFTIH